MSRRRENFLRLVPPEQTEAAAAGETRSARLNELTPQYEIVREIGRGGTAIVYQARDRELQRYVAIKVMRATHVDEAGAVARLAREARLVAQLRHPNIVPLFGTRRLSDGSLALIMQFVPGRTLKEAIRADGPMPVAKVLSVLRDIALALQYAHARHGVIHRDIKPENIYLDTELDRALLADFGIARSFETDASITLAGTALGTPAYMSPEQIDGETLDARSDLYSLGLVAWEMLTGQQPWAGHNLYTIIYKQKHEDLPALSEYRSDVPENLQHVLAAALRKHRELRWRDAAQFVTVLELLSSSSPVTLPQVTTAVPGEPVADRASPVRHHRPSAEPPSAAHRGTASDDALTVMYRRDEIPRTGEETVAASLGLAAPGAMPAAAVAMGSWPATPVSTDAQPVLETVESAAAGASQPAARRRHVPLLIFLLLLFLAGGNLPWAVGAFTNPQRGSTSSPADAIPAPPVRNPSSAGDRVRAARLVVIRDRVGTAGAPLSRPVAVLVEDSAGRAIAGASILFTAAEGSGSVAPGVTVSDSLGLAYAIWRLGEKTGIHELTAATTDRSGVYAVIRARARPGTPSRLVIDPQVAQVAAGFDQGVSVRVEDAHGNPVPGAQVEFHVTAGGGSVDPVIATSDSTGVARTTWTLGGGGETNTLRAAIPRTDIELVRSATPAFRLRTQSQLVVGGTHTCVLSGTDGEALCWGGNDAGQLGGGAGRGMQGALPVESGLRLARLASGMAHTCGLDTSGGAYCWGMNDSGQLGTGDRSGQNTPAPVRGVAAFSAITAGLAHTCALTESGRAFCWGAGNSGQLGDGRGSDRTAPVAVAGSTVFSMLSAGWRHTCGLAAGRAYCWGMNGDGQLGDGTTADRAVPTRVAASDRFAAITAGAGHTCALTRDGEAWCWGQNERGQLGNATNAGSSRPVKVETSVTLASIVAGAVHSCGLARSGEAYCWGGNDFGQLGSGDTRDSSVPVPVAGGYRFASLSAGGSHTCGRLASGEQYCWGYNADGQLGDGTRNERWRPARVTVARP